MSMLSCELSIHEGACLIRVNLEPAVRECLDIPKPPCSPRSMSHEIGSAFCFVILSFGLSLPLHAQESGVSIEVVATFDYPREGTTQTVAWAIANTGISVGDFRLPNNDIASYERTPNGGFSHPISFPGGSATTAQGINVSGVVCGYMDLASVTHGFFYDGQTYTQYDAPGSTFTFLDNDALTTGARMFRRSRAARCVRACYSDQLQTARSVHEKTQN